MTIRKPESIAAARLAQRFLANKGATLTYAQCLDLVAQLEGFKNTRHRASNKEPSQSDTQPLVSSEPLSLYFFMGEDARNDWEYGNPTKKRAAVAQATKKTFATEAEMLQYSQGVEDASGWMAYSSATAEAVAEMERADKGWTKTNVRVELRVRVDMSADRYQALWARFDNSQRAIWNAMDALVSAEASYADDDGYIDEELTETAECPQSSAHVGYNDILRCATFPSWIWVTTVTRENSEEAVLSVLENMDVFVSCNTEELHNVGLMRGLLGKEVMGWEIHNSHPA